MASQLYESTTKLDEKRDKLRKKAKTRGTPEVSRTAAQRAVVKSQHRRARVAEKVKKSGPKGEPVTVAEAPKTPSRVDERVAEAKRRRAEVAHKTGGDVPPPVTPPAPRQMTKVRDRPKPKYPPAGRIGGYPDESEKKAVAAEKPAPATKKYNPGSGRGSPTGVGDSSRDMTPTGSVESPNLYHPGSGRGSPTGAEKGASPKTAGKVSSTKPSGTVSTPAATTGPKPSGPVTAKPAEGKARPTVPQTAKQSKGKHLELPSAQLQAEARARRGEAKTVDRGPPKQLIPSKSSTGGPARQPTGEKETTKTRPVWDGAESVWRPRTTAGQQRDRRK